MQKSSCDTDRNEVDTLIEHYKLKGHPEGGYYSEIWRSDIPAEVSKKDGYDGPRVAGTSIYYLLAKPSILKWHRVLPTQFYLWHSGGTFKLHFIDKDGNYFSTLMGDTLNDRNCTYQVVIQGYTWIAGEVMDDGHFTFFSNLAVPGFEYVDWELGKLDGMVKDYPQHETIIRRFFP